MANMLNITEWKTISALQQEESSWPNIRLVQTMVSTWPLVYLTKNQVSVWWTAHRNSCHKSTRQEQGALIKQYDLEHSVIRNILPSLSNYYKITFVE